jgi:hypothetical protein
METKVKKSVRIRVFTEKGHTNSTMFLGKATMEDGKVHAMKTTKTMHESFNADKDACFIWKPSPELPVLSIDFEWTVDEQKAITSHLHRKEEKVLEFLKKHPLIQFRGADENKKAMFFMEILEENKEQKINAFERNLSAMSAIGDMTLGQLENLCYFYGKNFSDLDGQSEADKKMEAKLFLAGENCNGIVMQPNNIDEFLKMVRTEDFERVDELGLAKKAILVGEINKKDDGGLFTKTGDFIGNTEEDVVVYLRSNKGFLSTLKQRLKHVNYFAVELEQDANKLSKFSKGQIISMTLQEKKDLAKELKIQAHQLMKDEEKITKAILDSLGLN